MSMTKKFKISFEVSTAVPEADSKAVMDAMMELARKANRGEELTEVQVDMLVHALTYGVEGAVSFVASNHIKQEIEAACARIFDTGIWTVEPINVVEVK